MLQHQVHEIAGDLGEGMTKWWQVLNREVRDFLEDAVGEDLSFVWDSDWMEMLFVPVLMELYLASSSGSLKYKYVDKLLIPDSLLRAVLDFGDETVHQHNQRIAIHLGG